METEMVTSLLGDATVWVTIAFVIFVLIAFKYAKTPILVSLDLRTERIKAELAEAEELKQQAQELLNEYQKKHRDVMNQADEILEEAKQKAEKLQNKKETELEKYIQKRKEQAHIKIERAEAQALSEIQDKIVDLATAAAKDILISHNEGKAGSDPIDLSIKNIQNIA